MSQPHRVQIDAQELDEADIEIIRRTVIVWPDLRSVLPAKVLDNGGTMDVWDGLYALPMIQRRRFCSGRSCMSLDAHQAIYEETMPFMMCISASSDLLCCS